MHFNQIEITHIPLRTLTWGYFRLIDREEFDDLDGLASTLYADESERDTIDSTIEVSLH
jgi:hypothetical protein